MKGLYYILDNNEHIELTFLHQKYDNQTPFFPNDYKNLTVNEYFSHFLSGIVIAVYTTYTSRLLLNT